MPLKCTIDRKVTGGVGAASPNASLGGQQGGWRVASYARPMPSAEFGSANGSAVCSPLLCRAWLCSLPLDSDLG
jgi:hypothetical protein